MTGSQGQRSGTRQRRARPGAVWSLRAVSAVAAVLLGVMVPTPAAADDGLEVVGDTTYRLDAAAETVAVTVDVGLTNTMPSVTRGAYIQTPYFDTFTVPALGPVRNARARSSSGGDLDVDVEQDRSGLSLVVVDLSPNLVYGAPQDVTVQFDLPGQPPRSRSVTRVNPGFAAWAVFGVGDPGDIDITLDVPGTFDLTISKDVSASVTQTDKRRLLKITHITRSQDSFLFASANRDSGLDRERMTVEGTDVTIQAWPDDARWRSFAVRSVRTGLPVLADLIGQDVPEEELTVVESSRPYQVGYAGFYVPQEGIVDVGDHLDKSVMLHELSHVWFNDNLFTDRWLIEGLAEEFANRAMAELGEKRSPPDRIDRRAAAAVALNSWGPGAPIDASRAEVEEYAYNASYAVVHQLGREIGSDGLRKVIAAASASTIAYPGDLPPEEVHALRDWRYFYDLVDHVGGSEEVEQVFRDHVLTPRQERLLSRRAATLATYDALVEAGDGWMPPFPVRERLAWWQFAEATTRMEESEELLTTARGLSENLSSVDVDAAATLEQEYESAASLEELAATLEGYEAATADLVALHERREAADLVTQVGLVGADIEIDAAVDGIANGDLTTVQPVLASATAVLDGAPMRGVRMLAGAAGVVAAMMLVAVFLRGRRARRAGAPDLDEDPEGVGGSRAGSDWS